MSKKSGVSLHPCLLSQLRPDDVVFDVGAYRGNSTLELAGCAAQVYAFEPAPIAYAVLQEKVEDLENVRTYPFGLGDQNVSLPLGAAHRDGGSFLSTEEPTVTAQMVDIIDFCRDEDISDIALLCVNIEGGEFSLLSHMIAAGLITMVRSLMVYWHYVVKDAGIKHHVIEQALAETHVKARCAVHKAQDIYVRKDQLGEGIESE